MATKKRKTIKNFVGNAIASAKQWFRKDSWLPDINIDSTFEYIEQAREHLSDTIRKTMFTLIGFEAFVFSTLSAPDIDLISNKITMPILGTETNLERFLIAVPVLTIGILVYLQQVLGYYYAFTRAIRDDFKQNHLPFHWFEFPSTGSILLTSFLFYWLTPSFLIWVAYLSSPFHNTISKSVYIVGGIVWFWSASLWVRRAQSKPIRFRRLTFSLCTIFALIIFTTTADKRWQLQLMERSMDLRGEDLRSVPLARLNLRGANLSGAKLNNVKLKDVKLVGADLSDANLDGASLEDVNLWRANLDGASLRGAELKGVLLWHASLRHADLRNARLDSAQLQHADLLSADLRGASLQDADLEGGNLYGAKLFGTDLYGANLKDADIRYTFLNITKKGEIVFTCEQLRLAKNWWLCETDFDCGKDTLNLDSLAEAQDSP